jgi:hypothetical protein
MARIANRADSGTASAAGSCTCFSGDKADEARPFLVTVDQALAVYCRSP